jgi:hypothetical protein
MDEKDIILNQDVKVMQQLVKDMSSGEGNTFNNIGQINIISEGTNPHNILSRVLDLLPDPKLENLKLLAYEVAKDKCDSKAEAARYLGVSDRTLRPATPKLVSKNQGAI